MLICKVGSRSICITLTLLLLAMIFPSTAFADNVNNTYNTNKNDIILSADSRNDSSLSVFGETDGQAEVGNGNGDTDNSDTSENNTGSTDTPVVTDTPKIGITLDKTSAVLMVGESLSITPSISGLEAGNINIIWTSSNPNVATVDQTGLVNTINEGMATITAATEDGIYFATCDIKVYRSLSVPQNELGTAQNYDVITITWKKVKDATGYEVYRSNTKSGEYIKIAEVQSTEYKDKKLKADTKYYYIVRAYRTIYDMRVNGNYTPVITAKTLDYSIGSSLFLYMSNSKHRDSVFEKAVALHYGDPHNTCAYTVSEALRRIKLNIPTSTCRTNHVDDYLAARGWKRKMDLKQLQPGDICFTTDVNGNLLGGHSTHTFIFMGWANKEKTLMNICDNQVYNFGSVMHTRPIYKTKDLDATAFFYHTDAVNVASILKITSKVQVKSVSYNKMKISWDKAVGANGYHIYRATSKKGTYSLIGTTGKTNYTDSRLITGKTYYYRIKAYNKRKNSKIYGSTSAIYAAKPTFSIPVSFVKSFTKGKANLTWKSVSGASGYQIYRSTTKNGKYTRVGTTSATSYTNSGLVSGKTYYYKVRAYRNTGKTLLYSAYAYVNLYAL